jgi:hypothetical protein
MNSPSLEELHADPVHWKLGIFYFCRQDQRVIVPKRIRSLGWTINFARPSALAWVAFITLFAWSTVTLARLAGASHELLLTVKLLLALGIIVFCHRAASAATTRK